LISRNSAAVINGYVVGLIPITFVQFISEYSSVRIIKIGPYFSKLLQKNKIHN